MLNLQKQYFNSLKTKLGVLFILFAFLPVCILGVISIYMTINSSKQTAGRNNITLAKNVASQIGTFVESSQGLLAAVAESPNVKSLDAKSINIFLEQVVKNNPRFETVGITGSDGMQLARYPKTQLAFRGDRPYFQAAIKGQSYVSGAKISQVSKLPVVWLSVPIKDESGKIIAVMNADLSMKSFVELARQTKIGETGYVDIVDNAGIVLATPEEKRILDGENFAQYKYVEQAVSGHEGYMEGAATNGVNSITSFAATKLNWGVLIHQPIQEIYHSASANIWVVAGGGLLAVIIAGITALSIAKGITEPIAKLRDEAFLLAQGDLRNRKISVRSEDEVGQLAQAFTGMSDNLRNLVVKVQQRAETVAASSEQLTASAQQSAEAANQVAGSITRIAEGTDDQSKAIDSMSSVVQEISAMIEQSSSAGKQIAEIATGTAQSSETGLTAIGKATEQMQNVGQGSEAVQQTIGELAAGSREIGEIVTLISSIAGQTNLLALNAAIEAARAGEAGRGFAVVAEEVRKLAEDSDQAAKKIAGLIQKNEGNMTRALTVAQASSDSVKAGIAVVASAGSTFEEIAGAVGNLSAQIKDITQSIEQIAAGSESLVAAVQNIGSVSRENAMEAQTVSAATEEQSASMEEIAASSQALAQTATELQASITSFKVK